eukprot:gene2552-6061_t
MAAYKAGVGASAPLFGLPSPDPHPKKPPPPPPPAPKAHHHTFV